MNWFEYIFNLVDAVSQKSKDPSNKVGCVITKINHEIVSTGFNGFPFRVLDNIESEPERYERPIKYLYTEHAERNAIYLAARNGISLEGCTIWIQWFPCAECARAIIQSGIKKILIDGNKYDPNVKTERDLRWAESFDAASTMLHESGTTITIYKSGRFLNHEFRHSFNQSER